MKRDDLAGRTGAEYITETCFASYARPALSFQQRYLINLGMLVALNRGPELRIHVNAALQNGLTEEQIVEAIRHTMVYCGVPAGRDALSIVSEVLEQRREVSKRSGAKLS
ncbi:CMD-domain-containing protein [Pyrenochaeta sp. DS3sAY3a]|nr:CMD-domain-containing protein [Pyrenochaeta sp. DS3sAY3a]